MEDRRAIGYTARVVAILAAAALSAPATGAPPVLYQTAFEAIDQAVRRSMEE